MKKIYGTRIKPDAISNKTQMRFVWITIEDTKEKSLTWGDKTS
jgi:hypothetical protein